MSLKKNPAGTSSIEEIFIQNIYVHITIHIDPECSGGAVGKIKIKIIDLQAGIFNAFKHIYTWSGKGQGLTTREDKIAVRAWLDGFGGINIGRARSRKYGDGRHDG